MTTLTAVGEDGGSWLAADVHWLSVREVDCGKYSPDRNSPACEQRAHVALGGFVVVVVLTYAVGFVVWRLLRRKFAKKAPTEQ